MLASRQFAMYVLSTDYYSSSHMNTMHVVDSSTDDDSSVLEDDSSRSSSATPRPLVPGGGSHHSRGSAETRGSEMPSRSAQSHSGNGGNVSHSAGAARGATPPLAASRDFDATPSMSQPSCACSCSACLFLPFLCRF